MLLTSYSFVCFSLFLLGIYYLIPKRWQWKLLLAASILFYLSYGVKPIISVAVTVVSTYVFTRWMDWLRKKQKEYLMTQKDQMSKEEKKAYKQKEKQKRFRLLVLCLLLNFGILGYVKYAKFVIENINGISHFFGGKTELSFVNVILPFGISFYTFMAMGYLIDVYREKIEVEKNPFRLALFILFFPQLMQGPIGRYDQMSNTLFQEHSFSCPVITSGLQRVLWGYFKKLVVADRLLPAVLILIHEPDQYQGAYVLLGMLMYAYELYCDFTGGIDITIGLSQAFGVRLAENFNRPFFSKSIKEYWRRWHMSLGSWFTEYIFYPVSVCKPMLRFSKFARQHFGEHLGKRVPVYMATILVWFVTGIWHGAAWNFIVWGLLNCFFLMLSEELTPLYERFHKRFSIQKRKSFQLFQILRTILLMSCLRMLDCYRDVSVTFHMFISMFRICNLKEVLTKGIWQLTLTSFDYIVLLASLVLILSVSLCQRAGSVREQIRRKPFYFRFLIWYGLLLSILVFGAYGIGYDASQFIYQQF